MAKILIVEDNEMNRDMLLRRLQRSGFDIEVAVNGKEALSITAIYCPDIILMDMSLPIMDGWQATRHLKNNEKSKHIPVIGLSAHARDVDILKGLEAGCDIYETKPIDMPRLLAAINALLEPVK
jgi:two-component system, cell cycle response regulator DivK